MWGTASPANATKRGITVETVSHPQPGNAETNADTQPAASRTHPHPHQRWNKHEASSPGYGQKVTQHLHLLTMCHLLNSLWTTSLRFPRPPLFQQDSHSATTVQRKTHLQRPFLQLLQVLKIFKREKEAAHQAPEQKDSLQPRTTQSTKFTLLHPPKANPQSEWQTHSPTGRGHPQRAPP